MGQFRLNSICVFRIFLDDGTFGQWSCYLWWHWLDGQQQQLLHQLRALWHWSLLSTQFTYLMEAHSWIQWHNELGYFSATSILFPRSKEYRCPLFEKIWKYKQACLCSKGSSSRLGCCCDFENEGLAQLVQQLYCAVQRYWNSQGGSKGSDIWE